MHVLLLVSTVLLHMHAAGPRTAGERASNTNTAAKALCPHGRLHLESPIEQEGTFAAVWYVSAVDHYYSGRRSLQGPKVHTMFRESLRGSAACLLLPLLDVGRHNVTCAV